MIIIIINLFKEPHGYQILINLKLEYEIFLENIKDCNVSQIMTVNFALSRGSKN